MAAALATAVPTPLYQLAMRVVPDLYPLPLAFWIKGLARETINIWKNGPLNMDLAPLPVPALALRSQSESPEVTGASPLKSQERVHIEGAILQYSGEDVVGSVQKLDSGLDHGLELWTGKTQLF